MAAVSVTWGLDFFKFLEKYKKVRDRYKKTGVRGHGQVQSAKGCNDESLLHQDIKGQRQIVNFQNTHGLQMFKSIGLYFQKYCGLCKVSPLQTKMREQKDATIVQ